MEFALPLDRTTRERVYQLARSRWRSRSTARLDDVAREAFALTRGKRSADPEKLSTPEKAAYYAIVAVVAAARAGVLAARVENVAQLVATAQVDTW